MSACEKCWRDAGGNHERYLELLKEREGNPCTPAEQAGDDYDGAPYCSDCGAKHARFCKCPPHPRHD